MLWTHRRKSDNTGSNFPMKVTFNLEEQGVKKMLSKGNNSNWPARQCNSSHEVKLLTSDWGCTYFTLLILHDWPVFCIMTTQLVSLKPRRGPKTVLSGRVMLSLQHLPYIEGPFIDGEIHSPSKGTRLWFSRKNSPLTHQRGRR